MRQSWLILAVCGWLAGCGSQNSGGSLFGGGKKKSTATANSPSQKVSLSKKLFGDGEEKLTAEEKARLRYIEGRQVCAQNNYAGAVAYVKQAVEFHERAEYYNDLGRCYYMIGRYGDALRAYARAEYLGGGDDESHAELLANIGDVFRQREDVSEALKYYHEALTLSPDFARAHYEIGNLLVKDGKYAEAESRLTHALEIDPQLNKAMLSRMIAYRMTGQYAKAYQDLQDLDRLGFAISPELQREIIDGLQRG